MTNLFCGSNSLPLECTHSNKQHPYTVRVINPGIVLSCLPPEISKSSSEQSIKKYFGKNVRKMYLIRKPPSFNKAYRCKNLKTLKVGSLYSIRYPIRHIENLHVFDSLSWMPWLQNSLDPKKKKRFASFAPIIACKYIKCFEVLSGYDSISLKTLRALRNLQTIILTLGEEQFALNFRVILSLKSLKRLDLSILSLSLKMEGTPEGQSELPALSDFFIEVSKLGRLDFLAMRLTNIFDKIGPESRSRFLDCLGTTSIPAFNIEIIDTDTSRIDCNSLRACIKNIDLLVVNIDHNASILIACGTENNISQSMDKARKKLKIVSTANFTSSEITLQCSVSQANSRQSESEINLADKLEIIFKDCLGVPFAVSEASPVKHLKSFSLNLTSLPKEIDSLFLAAFQNANNLEHLRFQRDITNSGLKSDVYHYFSMISPTSAMQNLTSLHLIDFSVKGNLVSILSEIFKSAKNLKTLRLDLNLTESLTDEADSQMRLHIPENNKLADLFIRLPQLNKNLTSDFIKFILSLNELEVLTLPSGNQLIETEKNRIILVDGFKRLRKLREVSIFRPVKPISCFFSSVKNNHNHPVVSKVRSELKDLFDSNCSLWKCWFESNEPCYQIKYKRY